MSLSFPPLDSRRLLLRLGRFEGVGRISIILKKKTPCENVFRKGFEREEAELFTSDSADVVSSDSTLTHIAPYHRNTIYDIWSRQEESHLLPTASLEQRETFTRTNVRNITDTDSMYLGVSKKVELSDFLWRLSVNMFGTRHNF